MRVRELTNFYEAIREDNRILPSHIAVYMALFERWNEQDFQGAVVFTRREIMQQAKINGLATYHKCMRDLEQFGYIHYQPCFRPGRGSTVVFQFRESVCCSK